MVLAVLINRPSPLRGSFLLRNEPSANKVWFSSENVCWLKPTSSLLTSEVNALGLWVALAPSLRRGDRCAQCWGLRDAGACISLLSDGNQGTQPQSRIIDDTL